MHFFQVNGERSPGHYFLRDKRIIKRREKKERWRHELINW